MKQKFQVGDKVILTKRSPLYITEDLRRNRPRTIKGIEYDPRKQCSYYCCGYNHSEAGAFVQEYPFRSYHLAPVVARTVGRPRTRRQYRANGLHTEESIGQEANVGCGATDGLAVHLMLICKGAGAFTTIQAARAYLSITIALSAWRYWMIMVGRLWMYDEFRFGIKRRLYNWNLRFAREQKGLTQSQLAEIIGVSSCSVSHLETLKKYPSGAMASKVADALDSSVEALFPIWLKEFKFKQAPTTLEDRVISLDELQQLPDAPKLLEAPYLASDIQQEIETTDLARYILSSECLTERERNILIARFGLDDGISQTYGELSQQYKVTRERIRQIESKALKKLRKKHDRLQAEYFERP